MISTKLIGSGDRTAIRFARRAAAYFAEHPECSTFTIGDVKPGELFAVKWAAPEGEGRVRAGVSSAVRRDAYR